MVETADWASFSSGVQSGVESRDSGASFGDTLNSLAVFGASIGSTVGSTFKTVSQSQVPRTGIPTTFAAPPANTGLQLGDILLYAVIAVAVIFGIKMLRK